MLSVDKEEGNEEVEVEVEVIGFDSLPVCALLILVWSSSFS